MADSTPDEYCANQYETVTAKASVCFNICVVNNIAITNDVVHFAKIGKYCKQYDCTSYYDVQSVKSDMKH